MYKKNKKYRKVQKVTGPNKIIGKIQKLSYLKAGHCEQNPKISNSSNVSIDTFSDRELNALYSELQ
ncbi:hypothetical protein BpHYR1_049351 [Brachionus plicatilis]|uniref:Uncharacterized protein n=1 Tax=Brachionus plicatilis TaxID=10195 RepID=A0A3M7PVT7_BRAPC|nr:hypothetical protein BpHYR1_049351 [Brachionus plicatilis]